MESLNRAPTSIVNNTINEANNSSITINNNTQAPSQNAAQDTSPKSKKRNIDQVTTDELDALINSTQESGQEEEIDPVYLRGQPSVVLRPPASHYIIEDINVSRKFYEYQLEVKAVMKTHGFVIGASVFQLKQIETAFKTSLLGQSKSAIDEHLSADIYKIVKKLTQDQNRVKAIKSLSLLLPYKDHTCTKLNQYLDSILRHKFNDDEEDIQFQWPNMLIMDSGTKRPDAAVFKMDQDEYDFPIVFGEAKLPSSSNLLLVKDLLRIAMFSKDAIDFNSLYSVVSFQAAGNRVSFYIMQLKNDGL